VFDHPPAKFRVGRVVAFFERRAVNAKPARSFGQIALALADDLNRFGLLGG
jgi:hypothetical protein